MKTTKTLKKLINILYTLVLLFPIIGFLLLLIAYNVNDMVNSMTQLYFNTFSSLLKTPLGKGAVLLPFSNIINYALFVLAIYYLRKSVKSFEKLNFSSTIVAPNFKKAGSLFVFIGVFSIVTKLITVLFFQQIIQINIWIYIANIIFSVLEIKTFFIIIIGVFFLFFSKSFEFSYSLKQENDLTI